MISSTFLPIALVFCLGNILHGDGASLWDCSSDSDCTTGESTCVDGYCDCGAGYMFSTDFTSCLRVATAYGDECTEDLQCSSYLLTGGVCEDATCVCSDGYHYVHGRCWPSSGLGEECAADVNCYVNADPEATSCVDGVCVCSDGFYQREYRTCRRGGYAVGDECAINLDCKFENSYCDTSTYYCASTVSDETDTTESTAYAADYVETSSLVRRSLRVDENSTLIGNECASNDDCAEISNSRCGTSGTCVCNRATFASDDLTTCIPELGEDCDANDTVAITYAFCRDGSWSCGNARVFSTHNQICRKSTKYYDWSCLHDEQCYIFGPDSSCQNKRCLCNDGSHLVEEESFCWVSRGIGESCQADVDCYVEGLDVALSCSDSVCSCPDGTFVNANRTACKISDAVLGDSCEEDADCTTTNAACIDLVCSCSEYYYESAGACLAGIGSACSADSDCAVSNSTCSDEVCACSDDYVEYTDEACAPVSTYDGECVTDLQCSTSLANTVCDTDENSTTSGTCICDSDYHYGYGACQYKKVLGDSCTSLADCYVESDIERVVCRSGVCACDYDYTAETSTTCGRSDAASFLLSTSLGLLTIAAKLCV